MVQSILQSPCGVVNKLVLLSSPTAPELDDSLRKTRGGPLMRRPYAIEPQSRLHPSRHWIRMSLCVYSYEAFVKPVR